MKRISIFFLSLALTTGIVLGQQNQTDPPYYLQGVLHTSAFDQLIQPTDLLVFLDGEALYSTGFSKPAQELQLSPIPIKKGIHHLDVYHQDASMDHATNLQWGATADNAKHEMVMVEPNGDNDLGGGDGQECACNQQNLPLLASLWYQLIQLPEGYQLLASTDKGKSWYEAQEDEETGLLLVPVDSLASNFVSFSKTAEIIAFDRFITPSNNFAIEDFNSALPYSAPSMKVAPNPFKAFTQVDFTIPQSDKVSISVYNISGKLVHRFYGACTSGNNQLTIHTTHWSPGVYLVTLKGEHINLSQRIVCVEN